MIVASLQQFELVFDATKGGFHPFSLVLPGLVLAVIGIVLVIGAFRLRTTTAKSIAGSLGALAVIWGAWWSVMVYRENASAYASLRHALETGQYRTIQGPITDFQAETRGGRHPERWTVDGHTYELSSFRLPRTALYPGIVKPGMVVRIAEVDGQIARLEIAR